MRQRHATSVLLSAEWRAHVLCEDSHSAPIFCCSSHFHPATVLSKVGIKSIATMSDDKKPDEPNGDTKREAEDDAAQVSSCQEETSAVENEQDGVVTMVDVLEEQEELEENADAGTWI